MNICFFTTEYPNKVSGGVEHVTSDLASAFVKHGCQVHVISIFSPRTNIMYDEIFPGLITGNSLEKKNDVIDYIINNHINIIINQSHFQVTHSYLSAVKKSTNTKIIKVLHTDPAAAEKGVMDNCPILTKNIIKHCISKTLNIIRKSKRHSYLVEEYTQWYKLYDKIVLLSNKYIPVFISYIKNDPLKKITSISNPLTIKGNNIIYKKEKILLFVGRLCKQAKRPDRIVMIWEKIYKNNPDWELIVIGDGELKDSLITYCTKKQIKNIKFIGKIDPTPYYQKASILCLTSTYEGFGLVITEALSYNIIPFAFNSYKAVEELIKHGLTGFLIKPFNLNTYARQLCKLMRSEAEINKMRASIDKYFDIQKYCISNISAQWINLFNELLRE